MTSRFKELLDLRGSHALTGIPLGPLPAYLAVDSIGRPALVVPAGNAGSSQPLETDYLSLRPSVPAALSVDGQVIDGHFHSLSCKQNGDEVLQPFETVATALAEELRGTDNAGDQMVDAFYNLCELFRTHPEKDLTSARIGLWGELFIMRESGWYTRLAPYWHTETNRKYDFSNRNARLEVKATTGDQRSHTFAHGQLVSPGGTDVVIASLLLRWEEAGLTLRQMIAEARTALAGQTRQLLKLEKAVRATGMVEEKEDGPCFDEDEARANIRFYHAQDIPHFPMNEPPGVSGTTYQANLSGSAPMTTVEVHDWLAEFLQSN
jgi:hypothetical protein